MYDAFISYSHIDAAWVRKLAERLSSLGFSIFLDELEVHPGDVLVHALEDGVSQSASGLLVFSATTMSRPWVREEYAALLSRAVSNKLRFIPILYGDVELPPFAANRVYLDFRNLSGPDFEERVLQLERAIRR
jgi:hypothetical protein